ncbi:VWA domain-containing protein, partial [Candidatus Uhrbacteria bacterium]|nr:VWA domain-containing protein [Candidatus Uhrbacteria bacterium]
MGNGLFWLHIHWKGRTGMAPLREPIDVVFSFDTTGSMYPCLARVRRELRAAIVRLFAKVPGIRIGIIAHGDYCDRNRPYVTKRFPLSNDADAVYNFVSDVSPTHGGDAPECYELVLHEARDMQWSAGRKK